MTTVEIDLDQVTDWRQDVTDDIIPPGFSRIAAAVEKAPMRWEALLAEQTAAARRQLREMRRLVALTVLLGLVTVALGAVALNRLAAPAPHPAAVAALNSPRRVQLQIVGGSPAAEVIGHIAYTDGTEAEFAPGAYDVTGLAGVQIDFTAGPGETLCRIVVDNVLVAEEFAYSGGQAQCRWSER